MSSNAFGQLFLPLLLLVAMAVSAFPSAWSLDSNAMRPSFEEWPCSTTLLGNFKSITQTRQRDEDQDPRSTCNPFSTIQNIHGPVERLSAEGQNLTLARRVDIAFPGDNIDQWMIAQVRKTKPVVWEASPGTDANTAVFRKFGRNPFSLGTNGLCGCSSLWIISRKGVYATHYWESISFAPEKEWRNPGETNSQVFERTVIDGLKSGNVVRGRRIQARLDRDEIADDYIKSHLVHPERSWQHTPAAVDGYRLQWNKIKDTVKETIPELAPDNKWQEVIYNRLDDDDEQLFDTALGHVVFHFSPDHEQKRKAVLWVERRKEPYHDDDWE